MARRQTTKQMMAERPVKAMDAVASLVLIALHKAESSLAQRLGYKQATTRVDDRRTIAIFASGEIGPGDHFEVTVRHVA